jgi:hypothetical protein
MLNLVVKDLLSNHLWSSPVPGGRKNEGGSGRGHEDEDAGENTLGRREHAGVALATQFAQKMQTQRAPPPHTARENVRSAARGHMSVGIDVSGQACFAIGQKGRKLGRNHRRGRGQEGVAEEEGRRGERGGDQSRKFCNYSSRQSGGYRI